MQLFEDVCVADDWKEYVNDKKEGLLIETRVNHLGMMCVKANAVLDYSVDIVYELLCEGEKYR